MAEKFLARAAAVTTTVPSSSILPAVDHPLNSYDNKTATTTDDALCTPPPPPSISSVSLDKTQICTAANAVITVASMGKGSSPGYMVNECKTNGDVCMVEEYEEKDDEDDDDDDRPTSSVKRVEIFLETPVPDDNNELLVAAPMPTTTTIITVDAAVATGNKQTVATASTTTTLASLSIATPDDDDDDVDDGNNVTATAAAVASTKPKRLSDEFFSADDGDYDNDDDEFAYLKNLNKFLPTDYDDDVRMVPNPFPSVSPCVVPASKPNVRTLSVAQMLPPSFDEDDDSSLLIESSFIEDELSSSSNMLDLANEHDESSPHSSTSPIIIGLQDDDDAVINPNTDQELINHNDMLYFGANAESMDAIERNDLEQEQTLTGGFMLRCKARTTPTTAAATTATTTAAATGTAVSTATSTSDSKNPINNRLNQGLLFSSLDVNRTAAKTPKQSVTSEQRQKQATTPTSSRTKAASRFSGAGSGGVSGFNTAVKINLSESLGKAAANNDNDVDNDGVSERSPRIRHINHNNLVASSSSSSTSPISSTITSAATSGIAKALDAVAIRNRLLKSLPQFDAFFNGNSNDSSSSDKSFRTSNYSNASNSKLCEDHHEELSSSSIASPAAAFEKILCDFIAAAPRPSVDVGLAIASTSKSPLAATSHASGIVSKRVRCSSGSSSACGGVRSPTHCKYSNHRCSTNKKATSSRVVVAGCRNDEHVADDDDDGDDDVDDIAAAATAANASAAVVDVAALIEHENLLVEDEEVIVGAAEPANNGDDDQATSSSSLLLPLPMEQERLILPPVEQSAASNSRSLDVDLNFEQSQALMALENDHDYDDDTWADCEEITDNEEVCTCRDYSDEEWMSDDDELLPSREVDLSCYAQLTEENILANRAKTARNNRKRRMTETKVHTAEGTDGNGSTVASPLCGSSCDTTPGKRKRLLLLDDVLSPKLLPNTPSTSTTASVCAVTSPTASATPTSFSLVLSEKRTPRSVIPTRDNPPPELGDWLLQFQLWSHAERLLAVDQLIEHCEPTQVRHMMKVIEPQFQRDFISLLPKELALQVLSYLEPQYLLRAAQTCRTWRFLCDDNLLWKEKCKQSCVVIEPTTDRPKRGRAGDMPPISSAWKAAYMRQTIIEMNWRTRPIREPKILKGHDEHVITCLQFCGNRIVSGSDDNTLKVWSAITGKCLRTLMGHTGGVWSSQMSGTIIISGSTDRTLKVWNSETGHCTHTLYGHTSTVRCMHLHGNKVVSGSRDATLRVWDIIEGKCLHILVGHLAAVRCVQYDGKLVVSGAYDYMVKVWNPERQECLHTLQGHTNRVYSLQFDGVHVVSGSLDTSIRVWDAETGSCKHTLMGHQSLTSGMELRQNILVSGNADSTVKVWDITNGQCLQTLSGPNKHQSAVTCLQFNSRFVITSSDDGTVKLWDVRTGDFIRNLVALDSGGSGGVVWRIRANDTKLICAVGSRNGTEETKLMVLDFDVEGACLKCS